MISLLLLLTLGTAAPTATPAEPRTLSCVAHNTPAGKDRRCHVTIPRGATVRPCAAGDLTAGHCTAHPRSRLVAWIVATDGAECRIADKKTDWTHVVAVKVGGKTKPGVGRCELHVEVQ